MSDEVDSSVIVEDVYLQAAISVAIRNKEPVLPAVGTCYNCKDPVENNQLFCDIDCSMDYEKLKRNGKV